MKDVATYAKKIEKHETKIRMEDTSKKNNC